MRRNDSGHDKGNEKKIEKKIESRNEKTVSNKNGMRRWLLYCTVVVVIALSATVFSGCAQSGGAKKQEVNILSANYEELVPGQLAFLQEKFPDVEFSITCLSSGKLAAKIQAEGEDTDADILYALSSGYANILEQESLIGSFTPGSTYLPEYADPNNVRVPNGVWCGAILVNTEELAKFNLPEPKSYLDLLDPVYKGHIVMSSPVSSSTGYFFLLGLLNLYGEEAGWQYFDDLRGNIMQFSESGSGPASMVEFGECVIGLGIDYQGIALQASGRPVKVIFAEEGAPYDNDTILMVNKKGGASQIVLDVLKVMTSAEGNAVFNDYSKAVIVGLQDNEAYPADFKVLDMAGIDDADKKVAVLDTWSEKFE